MQWDNGYIGHLLKLPQPSYRMKSTNLDFLGGFVAVGLESKSKKGLVEGLEKAANTSQDDVPIPWSLPSHLYTVAGASGNTTFDSLCVRFFIVIVCF